MRKHLAGQTSKRYAKMDNKIEFNERTEVFKEIHGMPGYFASNDGRVRKGLTKIVKTHENVKGYITAQIMMDRKRFGVGVHRLVAMAFLGNVEGMEVDHLNADKKDNRVENLEIVTRAENMKRFHGSKKGVESYKKISESQIKRWDSVGRKSEEDKVVKCHISMTQAHHAATAGDRAGMIRRALDMYLPPINNIENDKNEHKDWQTDYDNYLSEFQCNECGNEGHEEFLYQRRVSNGEVWVCECCKTELLVGHEPNEDNY